MPNSSSFFIERYIIKEPFAPESMINFSNSSGDRTFFWFKESIFVVCFQHYDFDWKLFKFDVNCQRDNFVFL